MVRAYFLERFSLRLFGPLAAVIALAASSGRPQWQVTLIDAGFALLLLAQFRSWDDLADRATDAVVHPERVLVRAAEVTPLIAVCGALAVANICLAVVRDASGIAVAALALLDGLFGVWYLARAPVRTAAGDHLLLVKYPAMIAIVAGSRTLEAPLAIGAAAVVLYAAACVYEAWHDPSSPLARHLSIGGHS